MEKLNDTASDIEMLLNEKRKQYRTCQSKSRAGSTPSQVKERRNVKSKTK